MILMPPLSVVGAGESDVLSMLSLFLLLLFSLCLSTFVRSFCDCLEAAAVCHGFDSHRTVNAAIIFPHVNSRHLHHLKKSKVAQGERKGIDY